MIFLTKQEELFLLGIVRLQEPAYLVNIQQHLLENTGRDWAFGSLYITLDKLKKKGYVETYSGEPVKIRGGKAKKYYRLTEEGLEALVESRRLMDVMWEGLATARINKTTADEK